MEFVEAPEQRKVLFKVLAKSETGIEHQAFALDARNGGCLRPAAQLALNQHHDVGGGCLRAPFVGPAAHVHQHRTAFQLGHGLCHLRIPAKSADVIHDFRSRGDGGASDVCFVGVDRERGVGAFLLNLSNDRDHAFQFLRFADDFGRIRLL